MPTRKKSRRDRPKPRLSITLPHDQYDQIIALARKNRISTARVMREAVERLLRDDQPLFHFPQS